MKMEHIFGLNSIERLGDFVSANSIQRVLLVTGKDSFVDSGAAASIETLLGGKDVTQFNIVAQYSELPDILNGIKVYQATDPDLVVGVGGGSVLDLAKLIRIFSVQDNAPIDLATGIAAIEHQGIPLIAIPTTAGSGSEATHFSVVFIDQNKFSVAHEYLQPNIAIIDPALTYSMSPQQTAISGMDAFSQAIESLWSIKSSDISREWAAEAAGLVLEHLKSAVRSPTAISRNAMSLAAHLAGKAIDISRTTAPHALSYILTTSYGIAHGHAVSLTLGSFLEFNSSVTAVDLNDSRGLEYVQNTLKRICLLLGVETCTEGRKVIAELMNAIGLATHLSPYGVTTPNDCLKIVREVNIQRLSNNPRAATSKQLEDILLDLR